MQGSVLHTRFLHLGNSSGELEVRDEQGIDIEALTEGVGPHPLFNGIRRVVIAGLAEPEVEAEGGHLALRAPGLALSFEGAGVRESPGMLVVRVAPEGGT